MAREKYTNAVATTLNGSINNSVTSVVLIDASTWPTGNFRVVIDTEIMYCTSRSSNTLTVIRGAEGTSAASHTSGAAALHLVTAGMLDQYRLDLLAAAGMCPNDDSLSTDDDDFDDESFSGSWTTVQTTPNITVTEKSHRASILLPTGMASAQYAAFMKNKTPSANDYIQCATHMGGGSGGFPIPALFMANGSTYGSGKQIAFGFSINENQFYIRDMTGYNTHVSATAGGNQFPFFWPFLHLRMKWISNDHYTCYASPDGVSWSTVFSNQNIGSIGAAPTWLGFGVTSWGSTHEFVESFTYCRFSF